MTTVDDYAAIKPLQKARVYDLLKRLRYNVREWEKGKGGKAKASTNPKFCYDWSFENPDKSIAICIWHSEITDDGTNLVHVDNLRRDPVSNSVVSASTWKRRAAKVDRHLRKAYLDQLPVHAIILDGRRRDRTDPKSRASSVKQRSLDAVKWGVTKYDFETGNFVLTRGATPVRPFGEAIDAEEESFREGAERRTFRTHRHREWKARRAKIAEALKVHDGKLLCEVRRCGFDFEARYGALGAGYAHVHHLKPLGDAPAGGQETKLSELAIVCPNCHAMIHLGGKCRDMDELISH